jgi:flavin-dependent dehydrogenase
MPPALADPLTGEGIYNAMLSARMGAAAIEKALSHGPSALNEYLNSVAEVILPEMKEALVFAKLLAYLPPSSWTSSNRTAGSGTPVAGYCAGKWTIPRSGRESAAWAVV